MIIKVVSQWLCHVESIICIFTDYLITTPTLQQTFMHGYFYYPTGLSALHNSLALNSSKSESVLTGPRQRLCTIPAVAPPTKAGIPIP